MATDVIYIKTAASETITLDRALEFGHQIEQALKATSDPRYAEALGRVREVLERAVEVRDQMVSLDGSRKEARQHYEMLLQQCETLKEEIADLNRRKSDAEAAFNEMAKVLSAAKAEARKIAEKLANT